MTRGGPLGAGRRLAPTAPHRLIALIALITLIAFAGRRAGSGLWKRAGRPGRAAGQAD